jgi:hypothetical protein
MVLRPTMGFWSLGTGRAAEQAKMLGPLASLRRGARRPLRRTSTSIAQGPDAPAEIQDSMALGLAQHPPEIGRRRFCKVTLFAETRATITVVRSCPTQRHASSQATGEILSSPASHAAAGPSVRQVWSHY